MNIMVTGSFAGKLSLVTKIFCILNHFEPFSDLFTPIANNIIAHLCNNFKITGCLFCCLFEIGDRLADQDQGVVCREH